MKTRSRKQEVSVGKKIGGRRRPASGAFEGMKGDVISPLFLCECKRTDKESISLKKSWLRKIEKEAFEARKTPLIALQIGDANYYVLAENDFLALVDTL